MVLTYGIPPEFRGGVHLFETAIRHRVSPEFIGSRICVPDGVHCREYAGTGPVNLKVVPNECCLSRSPYGTINMRLSFPHPLLLVV